MAGEIAQQINTFLKKNQPTIYYNKIRSDGSTHEYNDVVFGRFLTLWGTLFFTGFFTSLMTLDDIDGWKTVNEGTDFEYEAVTNEGLLYTLTLTIFAPLMLASLFTAVYYYFTKPDIILDEADRNSPDKETEAKKNWASEQLEAARNKPRSFFSWGAKKHTDDIDRGLLMGSNSNSGSINHS